jgi:hypothetical protein
VEGAPAVCIDALDLGWKEGAYGLKYRVALVFYTGLVEKGPDGQNVPLTVAKFFNASFNEKSSLSSFVKQWMGQAYKLPDNDLEKLIGQTALLSIAHNATAARTYANIESIMKLPAAMADQAPPIPGDFVRLCEREDWPGPAPHPEMSQPAAAAVSAEKMPWE